MPKLCEAKFICEFYFQKMSESPNIYINIYIVYMANSVFVWPVRWHIRNRFNTLFFLGTPFNVPLFVQNLFIHHKKHENNNLDTC